MNIRELTKRAKEIRAAYKIQEEAGGEVWTAYDIMMGLVGDIGDLSKLVAAREGLRRMDAGQEGDLGHELADCLWSILILADEFGIDLDAEFRRTMDGIESKLDI
jgi:NTP pyrophosphatase (non-canonical NTP hydrolase)